MIPNNEPIYASCYGSVRYCPHRCLFRLYFGEIQCALDGETLRQFARKLNRLATRIEASPTMSVSVPMWLSPPGMDGRAVALCPDEVLDLNDLLAGSLALTELNGFLTDNGFLNTV